MKGENHNVTNITSIDDYYKIISDNPNEKLTEKFQIPQIKNGRNDKIAAIYTDEKTVPCNICIYKFF